VDDGALMSPTGPPPQGREPRGRATSPLRPKARRALMTGPQAGGPDAYEPRRSPMAFQPIAPRAGGFDDTEDGETAMLHSMAGLMNAQELRQTTYQTESENMIKACVKVFVTQVTPSYSMPWSRGEENRSTGSGFGVLLPPLEGGSSELHANATAAAPGARCIITNAHVVENYSLVQVCYIAQHGIA
jgi:hypothetical protein